MSATATKVPSDIAIAQAAKLRPIRDVAAELGLSDDELELYGKYKAKISLRALQKRAPRGRLVLVTGINPTPAGEGKSTVTVGVTQALRRLGKNAILAMREPSLGPVFGVKGGAAGGGYAQVVPMEDINLHFTGDFHAIASAHNLLSAMLDAHLHHGNALGLDVRRIIWPRTIDMNDRALRNIIVGLGGLSGGPMREERFVIIPGSEIMAILALATGIADLEERIARIIVGLRPDKTAARATDLKAQGAMTLLLKDAINPNLVQTLEGGPALVHCGPFGNIAHGCNSVAATQLGLALADIVLTEAGFGADLGAEKFFDIKCRFAGLKPEAAIIVATVRALKMHGGVKKDRLASGLRPANRHLMSKNFSAPPIQTKKSKRSARLGRPKAWTCCGATCGRRAGQVASPWRRRCSGCSRRASPRSSRSTMSAARSAKRSKRLRARSTARAASPLRPRRTARSSCCRSWAWVRRRCVWRRRSIHSPTIRRSWALPRVSRCMCATFFRPPAPASSWRLRETS